MPFNIIDTWIRLVSRLLVFAGLWQVKTLLAKSFAYKFHADVELNFMPIVSEMFILSNRWFYFGLIVFLTLWFFPAGKSSHTKEIKQLAYSLADLVMILTAITIIIGAIIPWLPFDPHLMRNGKPLP